MTRLQKPMTLPAVTKAQWIRLADVFWIGPLMIYGASKIENPIHRNALLIFGLSTIVYNARNYFENVQHIKLFEQRSQNAEYSQY